MADWSVQRRFPRYVVHVLCLYQVAARMDPHGYQAGWTLELSEGGGCLELGEQLQPQTPLQLRLQADTGAIEVEAQVIWAGQPGLPGGILHGVAFTRVPSHYLQSLRDLLRAPTSDRRAEIRLPLNLPVTCQQQGQAGPVLHGQTGDISRDGLLLLLPEVLSPGTALEVTLHTPSEPLTMKGKIVWTEPLELWTRGEPVAHGFQLTSRGWSIPLVRALFLENPAAGLDRLPSPDSPEEQSPSR
jgi:hypothetical protein